MKRGNIPIIMCIVLCLCSGCQKKTQDMLQGQMEWIDDTSVQIDNDETIEEKENHTTNEEFLF